MLPPDPMDAYAPPAPQTSLPGSSFIISEDDFVHAQRLHLRHSKARYVIPALLAVICILSMVPSILRGEQPLSRVLPLGIFFGLVWALTRWITPAMHRRSYRQQRLLQEPMRAGFDGSVFTVDSASGSLRLRVEDITRIVEDARLLLVYQSPRMFSLVPKTTPALVETAKQVTSAHAAMKP